MAEYFTCPKCGSHTFGRKTISSPEGRPHVCPDVRCHGQFDGKPCGWSGVWPIPDIADDKAVDEIDEASAI